MNWNDIKRWMMPVPPTPATEDAGRVARPDPRASYSRPVRTCGVPGCKDGVASPVGTLTVVDCETHNAITTYDTVVVVRQQKIIRAQDAWRQHGTSAPPGK